MPEGTAKPKRGDPTVILSMDEFGPLNLLPRPGRHWAPVVGRHSEGSVASPRRRRRRATYTRTKGVRHLFAALDMNQDKLYGHIKTNKCRTTFLAFCRYLRSLYPPRVRIAVVLDNYSPHLSTRKDPRRAELADPSLHHLTQSALRRPGTSCYFIISMCRYVRRSEQSSRRSGWLICISLGRALLPSRSGPRSASQPVRCPYPRYPKVAVWATPRSTRASWVGCAERGPRGAPWGEGSGQDRGRSSARRGGPSRTEVARRRLVRSARAWPNNASGAAPPRRPRPSRALAGVEMPLPLPPGCPFGGDRGDPGRGRQRDGRPSGQALPHPG